MRVNRRRSCLAIALSLVVTLPCAATAEPVRIGGTGGAMQILHALSLAFRKTNPGGEIVIVPGLGSRGGRRAISAGSLDIAVIAEPPAPGEDDQNTAIVEWARTPFAFGTSPANAASSLTARELVDIYAGRLTSWRDGQRLRLVLRPPSDSDNTTLRAMSPAMREAVERALTREGMRIAVTDQDSAEAIETVPGALGTTTLGLVTSEKRRVKLLAIDGVTPTLASLADGSYPYVKTLYLFFHPAPTSSLARRFLDFIRSPRAGEILASHGFLPVTATHPR